jgi:hypothetical protein
VQLTAVTTLPELFPELPPEVVEEYAARVAADDEFKDIQPVMGPTGIDYLYCETHMTGNYAALLARVEAKNPFATIAETVREESRTYPRPTRVALFYEPLFQMEPDMLESAVGSILQREEYRDIKRIVAATGAVYLYSDKYLTGARAEAWVQWHEVDQWDNP